MDETRPGSPGEGGQAGGRRPQPKEAHLRGLAALVAAAGGGLLLLALAEIAGVVLYQRLWNGSAPALGITIAIATVVGGYAAWLAAVVIFSAVRSQSEEQASETG